MGAVLSQIDPVTGLEYAISYASRACNPAESRYSATRGECKALEWAIEKYRYYLYGHFFKVRTDHQALQFMRTAEFQDAAVHRWVLKLQEYDFEAEHTPGIDNKVADYMSRGARRIEQIFSVPPAAPRPQPLPDIPTSRSRANSLPPPTIPAHESAADTIIPRQLTIPDNPDNSSPAELCMLSLQHVWIKAPLSRCQTPHRPPHPGPKFASLFRSRPHNRGIPSAQPQPTNSPDISFMVWATAISTQSLMSKGHPDPNPTAVNKERSTMRSKILKAHADSDIPDEAACPVCLQTDATRQMLACDSCNRVYHTHCLPPPHNGIPSGPWFCPECNPDDPLPFLCDHTSPISYSEGDPYTIRNLHAYIWARATPHTFGEYSAQIHRQELSYLKRISANLSSHPTLRDEQGRPWLVRTTPDRTAILPPAEYRWNIIRVYHHRHGHAGIEKLLAAISKHINWKGMKSDISAYVLSCDACQRRRHHIPDRPAPAKPPQLAPMQQIHVDLAGPYPPTTHQKSQGITKPMIMIMVDSYTKVMELVALPNKQATTCARALYDTWLCRYTKPDRLVSDQGSEFQGEFDTLLTAHAITHVSTRARNPQANGNAERTVGTVKLTLSKLADGHINRWPDLLPEVRSAYMQSVHASLGMSPFQALTGLPTSCLLPISASIQPTISEVEQRAHTVHLQRSHLLDRLRNRIASQYNRQLRKRDADLAIKQRSYPLVTNGKALMLVPTSSKGPRPLADKLTGPFTVKQLLPFKAVLRTGDGQIFERGLDQLTRYFTPHEAIQFGQQTER